jgi:hypothetical protein
MENFGALCFGIVIGWVTYRTLRRTTTTGISDIATVIGALGGAAITGHFGTKELFAYYCMGLAVGFFGYLIIAGIMAKVAGKTVDGWMESSKKN